SNLAGFGMALLPGLIGGGLRVSWAPLPEPKPEEAAKGRRGRRARKAEAAAAANAAATSEGVQMEGDLAQTDLGQVGDRRLAHVGDLGVVEGRDGDRVRLAVRLDVDG
ncbi:hypothetical protein VM98_37455, partial [Streptomyces rubellomurinus subsp. indigoferus]